MDIIEPDKMPNPLLITGEPTADKAASFTQFILPFAYRLEVIERFYAETDAGAEHLNSVTYPDGNENEKTRQATNSEQREIGCSGEVDSNGEKRTDDRSGESTKDWIFKRVCCCSPLAFCESDETKQCSRCKTHLRLTGIDERLKYLTSETANVLFERAKWFQLCKKNASCPENSFRSEFEVKIDCKALSVVAGAVNLVLFEFPEDIDKSQKTDDKTILQVGFLILETFFDEKSEISLHHLNNFNELFRYIDKPWPKHFTEKVHGAKFMDHGQLHKLHGSEGTSTSAGCKLCDLEQKFYGKMHSFLTSYRIDWDNKDLKIIGLEEDAESKRDQKNVFPDNRAFVWTCAVAKNNELSRTTGDGHWAKFLNVDYMSPSYSSASSITSFEEEWLEDRTYRRWAHCGTLYGFTSHSGAMLGYGNLDPPTHLHFKQMYLDQILLLLYLKCGLFRFSAKLNEITGEAQGPASGGNEKVDWERKFVKLRWAFTVFANLYQFPLLSSQQQSLEMYSKARESMVVNELFKELQEEIHNSHDYLRQQHARDQAEIVRKLTWVATVFLPATLVTSFFGMDQEWTKPLAPVFGERIAEAPFAQIFLFLATLTISIFGYKSIAWYLKRDNNGTE